MTSGYYPLIPPREDFLERRIRALEQQVEELQAGRKLSAASFRGGAFRFLDDAGAPRFTLGHVTLTGEVGGVTDAYGQFVFGDGGAVVLAFREGDRGWAYPTIPLPAFDYEANIVVTAGSFTNTWASRCDFISHEVVMCAGWVNVPVGSTAEVRLHEFFTNQATSAATLTGRAESWWVIFRWLHPSAVGLDDPRSERWRGDNEFRIQARRTAGAGNVTVYHPSLWVMTSRYMHPDADSNGAVIIQ
jgi:hypothetical protein